MPKTKSDSQVSLNLTFDSAGPAAASIWKALAQFLIAIMGEDGAREVMEKTKPKLERRLANQKSKRRTITVRREKVDADQA